MVTDQLLKCLLFRVSNTGVNLGHNSASEGEMVETDESGSSLAYQYGQLPSYRRDPVSKHKTDKEKTG